MLIVERNNIHITRGDSALIGLDLFLSDGSIYVKQPGDSLRLNIKRKYTDTVNLLEKPLSDIAINLTPQDTNSLPYGNYWYDIELTTKDGNVYTVVGPSRFVIREEVGF